MFRHNVITDFSPLSGLIKLERIWMHENPPADLSPLSGLISLTGFHSWGTPIVSGLSDLAGLPKLTTLDICGGELSDLSDLEGLTELKRVVSRRQRDYRHLALGEFDGLDTSESQTQPDHRCLSAVGTYQLA